MRLFLCALCGLLRGRLADPQSWGAIEVAERFADDGAGLGELRRARHLAQEVADARRTLTPDSVAWLPAAAAEAGIGPDGVVGDVFWLSAEGELARGAANLFRDVVGNPFRPLPVLGEAVLAWRGGLAVELARSIYEERAFGRLPILGDALEEAGCSDPFVLSHCHNGGEHARGGWVVDLVLGRR
jgi:hypothetical protein